MGRMNDTGRKQLQVSVPDEAFGLLVKCQAKLEQQDRLSWKNYRVVHLALNTLADKLGIEVDTPPEKSDGA